MVRVGESEEFLCRIEAAGRFHGGGECIVFNVATAMAYPMLRVVGIGSILLLECLYSRLGAVFADFGNNLPFLTRF